MDKSTAVQNYVMHHVVNSDEWHLPFGVTLHLSDPFSLHAAMLFVGAFLLVILFCVAYNKDQKVPSGITNLLEVFVVFIRDEICVPSLGKKDGRAMTPYFCTVFFFILCLNVMGLIPAFSTATANINVTAALAFSTFLLIVFGAIVKNGIIGFIKAFIPHGVPFPVLIILTPIEFLGIFIKCFALTIRLFANMIAGHVVILSLIGFIYVLGKAVAVVAVPMALAIYLLEVLVAFIQAYIFTLLSALFTGMVYHPAH